MMNSIISDEEVKQKLPQVWQLRQKSSELAALTILMTGDDFEELVGDVKDSVKMIAIGLASDIRKLSTQLAAL